MPADTPQSLGSAEGGGARHAPVEVIEAYDKQGINGVLVVDGPPAGRVRIAPRDSRVSLLVQVTDNIPGPDLQDRANLAYELHEEQGLMWHHLDVAYGENLAEVYPVLCAILDRIQVGGEPFSDAVDAVLSGLGDILAGRGGLTHERQVGLFGELVVLLSLAVHTSAADAVAAWRGPDREEHDFGLPGVDIEVKTTTAEQRSHWIGSLTQLRPTPGRELLLLSLQITAAGNGPGATLTELVTASRTLTGVPLAELDTGLASSGWHARHSDLYRSRWALRTAPTFHRVDDTFPALTPARVAASVPDPQRITDVRYRVSLDGFTAANQLFAVALPQRRHSKGHA